MLIVFKSDWLDDDLLPLSLRPLALHCNGVFAVGTSTYYFDDSSICQANQIFARRTTTPPLVGA